MKHSAVTVSLVALFSAFLTAQSIQLHPLDDAGVQAAIEAGADEDARDDLSRDCTANPIGDSNRYDDSIDLSASINHVVIRPEDREGGTIQPLAFETEPESFQNLLGAEFVCPLEPWPHSLLTLRWRPQPRDLEVVIITPAGERRCNVDNDRIYRMFHLERPE